MERDKGKKGKISKKRKKGKKGQKKGKKKKDKDLTPDRNKNARKKDICQSKYENNPFPRTFFFGGGGGGDSIHPLFMWKQ